jgi:hypothetical protein
MTIRADSDPKFYLRFLLIGGMLLVFGLWSLYDGAIRWPAQTVRALKYKEFKDDGRISEWPEFAREQGWPTTHPGDPKTTADLQGQFIMAAVCGVLSLLAFIVVLRSRGQWIEAGKTGLTSSWGQSLDYDSVVSLDKKNWDKKGIARLYYLDGERRRRFVIDDFKFKREPTDDILREVEARIGHDKIINGFPEPPPGEEGEFKEYDEADAAAR